MPSTAYKIRIYESGDGSGGIGEGEIVHTVDRGFSVYAYTANDVEAKLCKDVVDKKLEGNKIFQVCPPVGCNELTRTLAVNELGAAQRVFLDPASGLYSAFRRVRYPEARIKTEIEAHSVNVSHENRKMQAWEP